MLPFFITLPLAAAFLASLAGRFHRHAVEAIASATCLILGLMSCLLISRVSLHHGVSVVCKLGGFMPGVGISLVADDFSVYMLTVVNLISLAIALYSLSYMKRYTDTWKYYTLFMIMIAGVNGVILTGDIFNMFVFLEIASISVYALVAFGNEDEALEASFKYAVMGSMASSFLLLGIAFLYSYTSTLNLADMSDIIAAEPGAVAVRFASALFLAGLGIKAALAPFHAWMPDVYANAPAPVPAMSSGVVVKALGVYALTRLFFNVFGMNSKTLNLFIGLAVLSMVLGSIMACRQTNLKRFLGFSGISQVGYIFLGLGIGTPLSIGASLLHIMNHSVAKSLLFMTSGEMEEPRTYQDPEAGSFLKNLSPTVRFSSLAGVLSLCGIPPFVGFWSKLLIIISCLQVKRPGLALVAASVSMLTIAYYFKVYAPIVFVKDVSGETKRTAVRSRSSLIVNFVLIVLSIAALLGGVLLIPGIGKVYIAQASSVLLSGVGHITAAAGAFK